MISPSPPQSKVIPILKPEFVADSVVSATLGNKELMLLPWWAGILLVLKVTTCLLPAPCLTSWPLILTLPSLARPPLPWLHESGNSLRNQLLHGPVPGEGEDRVNIGARSDQ